MSSLLHQTAYGLLSLLSAAFLAMAPTMSPCSVLQICQTSYADCGAHRVMQRNEGRWDFSMEESEDGKSVVLEVDVGKYLDTSLIKADVQPTYIR